MNNAQTGSTGNDSHNHVVHSTDRKLALRLIAYVPGTAL